VSEYEERQEGLREQIAAAHEGLAGLSEEDRQGAGDELRRLEETLGFTATLIDQTDPELVL
jgi:hypothetical protein